MQEKQKIYKINPKQLKKSHNRKIYINNYFKCKWIKCAKKKLGWLNGYKNKIHMYAVYKKPTSDLKTHID